MNIEKTLDVKGTLCPLPVIKARQAITQVNPGSVLEILATDPATRDDIPSWIRRAGHEIIAIREEQDIIKFYVRRGS